MARSMPSTPRASTRSIAPAANTRSASSTSPQHHPPNQPQLGSIHHPQNRIGVSALGSQSRRKESSLINQWYLPLYGCGACGVVVNALELSTTPQANLLATATLQSATLGEPENPSLNFDPGCIKVVDTYRSRSASAIARPRRRSPSLPGSDL